LFIGVEKAIENDASKNNMERLIKEQKSCCSVCGSNIDKHARMIPSLPEVGAVCSICYYSQCLNKISHIDKGKIMLMPYMSQTEINQIFRVMWYIENEQEEYQEEYELVNIVHELFNQASNMANIYYSSGVSNVDLFIQLMFSLGEKEYNLRSTGCYGLRWIPNKNIFKEEISHWSDTDFKKYPIDDWKSILQDLSKLST
jgi:hypothetical protein